jgi:hypothetical protein
VVPPLDEPRAPRPRLASTPLCWSICTAIASARARLDRGERTLDATEPVEEAPDAKPAETR